MISDNGDDKKTQKSRSVPILSSPATGVREHVPSEVSINSNYACEIKHGLDARLTTNKYQQFNPHTQDDLISGTDTSSSEIYGKSPCFVLPKKRRKSNRDNYWPIFEQNRPILEENAINEAISTRKPVDSTKVSVRVRSSGFFVPNWSAAGEECVDDLESTSDFRDENEYSQDEDPTQPKTEPIEDDGEKSENKSIPETVEFADEVKDKEEARNECDEMNRGNDDMESQTYEQNFQHFMTACEEELLENEAFPKLWASDLSCTEDHGLLSSSRKTSECLEGSKASLCLDGIGLGFIEDDVELQLATAAEDVVQTIIREEEFTDKKTKMNSVDDFVENYHVPEKPLSTVICSHMTVEQCQLSKSDVEVSLIDTQTAMLKKQSSEIATEGVNVTKTPSEEYFDSNELEQIEKEVQDQSLIKNFSHDNVLTPSEECIIEMYDRNDESDASEWPTKKLQETNNVESTKSKEMSMTDDLHESKGVLTISLEKLHLERKRIGSFCQVNNLYVEKPEAFENYVDSEDGGRSSQNNTSGMEEAFSPHTGDYYTTEKACQMTPRMTSGGKVQSQSEENCKSFEGDDRCFVTFNSETNNTQTECDFNAHEENVNKMIGNPMCAFSSRGIGLYCNIPPTEKAPLFLCDDIKLFKQRRNIRPHSASTNQESVQENALWTQHLNEINKQRPKMTPKSFLVDKSCADVRSDECLSCASVISPSGISENVDVESPSWSNESVNKYREFAKMRKRELLARFVAERKHREELDQLLAQLHDSYDKLLAKHAEAENTIDQLRLGKPMKIENLRLSPSLNYAQLESQINSLEYPKSLPSFPISPRIHNSSNLKESLMKRHNIVMDSNLSTQFGGFSSNIKVSDNFCQTDFYTESVNEPFCSSVASFLLRANCLLEQVNSLHECMIEGINIEPNVALQMLSYLWESYLSLQHDVQAHVGHSATLEKIALEDVHNILTKIHSQLVAIETHHANVSWKGLLPFMEKKLDVKNFSFLRETSSYGSLPTSPTVSSNSQQSESRDNFSMAEVDSGCLISEKKELKPNIKRPISKQQPEMHNTAVDTSDFQNTNLDKVESKSSNESECIEVVKTLLRAIHSEEIQSTLKERNVDINGKATSLSETQPAQQQRPKKNRKDQIHSELESIFVLCQDNTICRSVKSEPYSEDISVRQNTEVLEETIDISCKTCRRPISSTKEKGDFQLNSAELLDNMEITATKSTPPMSEKFSTSDKMSNNDTDSKETEHQETLNLLATLDTEQRKILEETLRLLTSAKVYTNHVEVQVNSSRSGISIKESVEQISPTTEEIETDLTKSKMTPESNKISKELNEVLLKTKDTSSNKKDVFIRLLDEIKHWFNSNCRDAASEAYQSEEEWEMKEEKDTKPQLEVRPDSELGSVATDINSEHFENINDEKNLATEPPQPKIDTNDLSESSEFSTESFSEVNSEVTGLDRASEDTKNKDDKRRTYVYLRENEENNDKTMFEKLNKQIQQLRYELLERGLHGDDIYNKAKTQSSQTELEKTVTKDQSVKENSNSAIASTAADNFSAKIRNGDTILHCCGIHHLVRQKNCRKSPTYKSDLEDLEEEKLPRCPYCHQLIGRVNEPKIIPLRSSVSSDMIIESEDQQSSNPVTTPGLNNEDDCSVQKCSSFTESESTNMDTTTLITAVCNCVEETTGEGNNMSSQVREVFFAMLECDGYGTKECYAAVETSNTLKQVPTIESVSSGENVSQSPSNYGDGTGLQILDEKRAEFWNKSEEDFWYGYPISHQVEEITEDSTKNPMETKSIVKSPSGFEEQSWSSHDLLKNYQTQINQQFETIQRTIEEERKSEKMEMVKPESPSPQSPTVEQGVEIVDFENDRFENAPLSSQSDYSPTPDGPASEISNEQTFDTIETSLESGAFNEIKLNADEFTRNQSTLTSSVSYNRANKETMAEVMKVNEESQSIDDQISKSISPDKLADDESSLIEESISVADELSTQTTICEVSETEEPIFIEVKDEKINVSIEQINDLFHWSSVGIQVEPSQHDANVQVWPSLKDRDTQMTSSGDSSQDTDADAMSFNSKDQTEHERSDKCSTAEGKFSAQSLTLTRKNDDSTETDELVTKKGHYQQPLSDSELPKTRKHLRKVSNRSHTCSLQSSQNDNHQSCKSCARLLRKTEALATTMLKELKGHPLTSESSDENVEMKKLQLIHALDLANKIAKRLKHHSVQMLQSLNPAGINRDSSA